MAGVNSWNETLQKWFKPVHCDVDSISWHSKHLICIHLELKPYKLFQYSCLVSDSPKRRKGEVVICFLYRFVTVESWNILNWKRPTKIIESKSWFQCCPNTPGLGPWLPPLGSLFQCLTTLPVKNIFLVSNLMKWRNAGSSLRDPIM